MRIQLLQRQYIQVNGRIPRSLPQYSDRGTGERLQSYDHIHMIFEAALASLQC